MQSKAFNLKLFACRLWLDFEAFFAHASAWPRFEAIVERRVTGCPGVKLLPERPVFLEDVEILACFEEADISKFDPDPDCPLGLPALGPNSLLPGLPGACDSPLFAAVLGEMPGEGAGV